MRSDDALATILVVSRLADEGTQPLKASEYWRLLEGIGDPGALLGPTAPQLIGALDAELADRVTRLLDRATSIAFELERLDQSGIATLTPFDADYPRRWVDRLGPGAPPVVHAAGPLALLQQTAVGIVSSGDTDADAETMARRVGREAAASGYVLATGGGDGADRPATDAALEAGGSVIGILAHSLLQIAKRPEVRRAVHAGTTLLCTPYAPAAAFSTARAAGRTKLIHAQSRLTIVLVGEAGVWRGPDDGPIGPVDLLAELLSEPEPDWAPPEPDRQSPPDG